MNKTIVFDIGIPSLLGNKLFNPDLAGKVSHTLLPLIYLYSEARKIGLEGITPDVYLENPSHYPDTVLFSHMNTEYTQKLIHFGVKPAVITNQESPLIAYRFYFSLKKNIKQFKHAFLFKGFGKKISDIQTKIHTMYFPQPYSKETIIEARFQGRKLATMVVGNKRVPLTLKRIVAGLISGKFYKELYKERLNVIKYFSGNKNFDLYGLNWDKSVSRAEKTMRSYIDMCYRGSVEDKQRALENYKFTFALENTICPGYVTEKIFDAIFAGSVPVYLGAPDITDFIPADVFVDMRKFPNYAKLEEYLSNMPESEYKNYIKAMNRFIKSDKYAPFSQEKFADEILKIFKNE